MQLHQLKPKNKLKKKKRIGRGGKRGTYSGKGMKGQNSRAGRKLQPIIREIIKRYPKLRGYREQAKEKKLAIINLEILEKYFQKGELVNPTILLEKGIISKIKGVTPEVKILGRGEISKQLSIENCFVSKQAKEKIEKIGGNIINSKLKNQNAK